MVYIVNGNSLQIPLADESVHMCVTSPPYWALRDYGTGRWVGGDEGCGHTQVRRSGAGSSTLTGRQSGNNHEQEPFRDVCGKCGAVRVDNQLGLEALHDCLGWATGQPCGECYICHMVAVFREVKRVLRPDGTLWVNIGDSYVGGGRGDNGDAITGRAKNASQLSRSIPGDLKAKDLAGIPWRVAFALQTDGWWLRGDNVWHKPNPMPESVKGWRWERHRIKVKNSKHATDHDIRGGYEKMLEDASVHRGMNADFLAEWADCPGCEKCSAADGFVLRRASWRPTKAHEYVFLFSKSEMYYCDDVAVMEPVSENTHARISQNLADQVGSFRANGGGKTNGPMKAVLRGSSRKLAEEGTRVKANRSMEAALSLEVNQRNLRSVWTIATAPYSGAHFATFPPALVEPCIKAGTSERGVCPRCGKPWVRVVEGGNSAHDGETESAYPMGSAANRLALLRQAARSNGVEYQNISKTIGWRFSCMCDAGEPVPAVVFDPFAGSGTTLLVARQLGRKGVGLDLSMVYLREQARVRLGLDQLDAWQSGAGKEDGGAGLDGLPLFG